MKIGQALLRFYSSSLSVFVLLGAIAYSLSSENLFFFLLFLPVIYHFLWVIFKIKTGSKILLYYDFILVTVMAMMGFVTASTVSQLVSAILFCPLAFYFWLLVIPGRKRPLTMSKDSGMETIDAAIPEEKDTEKAVPKLEREKVEDEKFDMGFDMDRRKFVKLIGTTGLALFLFSLFSRKAGAPFFGSAPAPPGTVGLKDSSGTLIDPAVKQPTDGYKISEIDDSNPTYFGFVDKTSKWFIMQETDTGAFRYVKGDINFATNWTNRASLTYDYYDAIF